MEASVLEDGGLLNQITVVFPGQIFPLRLIPPNKMACLGSAETAAWIKVAEDDSSEKMDGYSSEESDISSSSDSDYESSGEHSSNEYHSDLISSLIDAIPCRCVRLMAETEILVIPKPRIQEKESSPDETHGEDSPDVQQIYSPSAPLRVQPTCSDVSNLVAAILLGDDHQANWKNNKESSSLSHSSLLELYLPSSPPLGHVCVHPLTLMKIPGYQLFFESQLLSPRQDIRIWSNPAIDTSASNESIIRDTSELPWAVVTIRKVGGPHSQYSPEYDAVKGPGNECHVAVATIYASDRVHEGHIGRLLQVVAVTALSKSL